MTDVPPNPLTPPSRLPGGDKKPAGVPDRGPIRNGLESLGMAVLMAILLKYFTLEAYVIPTPSMQPTLMGAPPLGETDRILVDKLYYLLHEPKRWDIAVFRYPVRQVQSYVKRIVGVGGETGERLRILGGNLYKIEGDKLKVLRKPGGIQQTLWREIYPMRRRMALAGEGDDPYRVPTRDEVFRGDFGMRSGKWAIDADDGAWIGTPRSTGKLEFSYKASRNDYTDGYGPPDLASAMLQGRIDGGQQVVGDQAVQDLRIGFDLTPTTAPDKVAITIDIATLSTRFSLEAQGGKAVLKAVRDGDSAAKTVVSPPFDFAIPAGEPTTIRFARLDDRLLAWHNGVEIGSFDVDELAIHDDFEAGKVVARVAIEGAGECRFQNVTVERDLHYTRSRLPKDAIITVPAGHFFMMGDNTLGSADGRDWKAVQIGVRDGHIVDPRTIDADPAKRKPGERILWGNKRAKAFEGQGKPHDDDNPVPLHFADRVVFVDDMGEIHALHGKVDPKSWGKVEFVQFGIESTWIAPEKPWRFVPRKHIQGRPIARFLRSAGGLKFTSWIR